MRKIIALLPQSLKESLKSVRDFFLRQYYRGSKRFCPICEKTSRCFRPYGALVIRKEVKCVHCDSHERHRLLWLFINERTDLFDGRTKSMLHVAPERCLRPKFETALGSNYLTADLFEENVMVKMDITDIHYPDESFDVIYCSHVLEHVSDDQKAMREFHRVLKKDGWAILLVPIMGDKTFEDPSIIDPAERLKAFGQGDHVRKYGPDYVDRLRNAGFTVEITKVEDMVSSSELVRLGLTEAGSIYYCRK